MATLKNKLKEKIKRSLGYPLVKVELTDEQITDNIYRARNKFIKFAAGHATQEVFFTIPLSSGVTEYDMPTGCVEIISYDIESTTSGINTLFTIEHYLYETGLFDLLRVNGYGYNLISYHIALDFLEMLERYTCDAYNFKYHKYQNILEIQPPPTSGSYTTLDNVVEGALGYILLRGYFIRGSTLNNWNNLASDDNDLYDCEWIEEYASALCKITLGMIRRKFGNFSAMGNQGVSLDGDTLVSEGMEEKRELLEKLKLEEVYDGYGIIMG